MRRFSIWLCKRELAGVPTASAAIYSAARRAGIGSLARLWSTIARPFSRSIYTRFQCAFVVAILGLVLMAAITLVSGRILMNTYESSVAEARFELMPAHRLQTVLREAEHLAYLYAIQGDRSVPSRFKEIGETVNREFQQLTENTLRFDSVKHAHSNVSISETVAAWQTAQAAALHMFQFSPSTTEAIDGLKRAHATIDPVYDAISEFHRGSMEDLQKRLQDAHSIADQAYAAILGAILIGIVVLIAMGLVVGRSVLQPLVELQGAARKLGEKDFTHRVKLSNTRDELGQLGRAFNIAAATLQRLYGELERRSTHDGLTGAFNRAGFDARLSAECKSADRHKRSLSLLMVDIDFFKRVNDTHGHQTGDQVLQTLVRLMNETIRPGDILARYGGEEFIIILPETDEGGAMAMAERVRGTVEGYSFNCPIGVNIGVTVSIGCANRRAHAMASEDLVKAADAALYQAKKTGRNRVVSARELSAEGAPEPEMAAA